MIFPSRTPLFLPKYFFKKSISPSNLIKLGIIPSIKTLNLFLTFLYNSKKSSLLFHFFSQISQNSIKINSKTCFLVAKTLLQSHKFNHAQEIFSLAKQNYNFAPKKGVLDSILQCICLKQEDPERAFRILNQCVKNYGIFPSFTTFKALIFKFSSFGSMEKATEVLEVMKSENFGYKVDSFICSVMVSGYCKVGKTELGLGFYEKVQKENEGFSANLVCYTSVVNALCKESRVFEACDLVKVMEEKGIVLDEVLYSTLVCGFFKKGCLMEGMRMHKLILDNGIVLDVVNYTNVIDRLCKEGNVEKAIAFLSLMEKNGTKPNLLTYSVLLQGFCKRGKMEEAFCIMKRMEELGFVLDEFVYAILIDRLCKIGELDRVFNLLGEMESKGIDVGLVTYNTVVTGLCKTGKTSKADEMSRGYAGDNFTFSTLLHGYAKEIDVGGVMETKRRLEEANICIDVVTANVLIKALFMVGLNDDACMLFKEMRDRGLVANFVTYCTMIDNLCKLGIVNKALEVFEEYRSTWPLSNSSCHLCIIRGLCKEHMLVKAIELFKELAEKSLVSDSFTHRKLIKAQFLEGNGESVLKLIHTIDKLENELLTTICNDAILFLCKKRSFTAALATCIFMRRRCLSIANKSYYFLLKNLIRSDNKLITELLMCDCIKVKGSFGPRMTNILSLFLCNKNAKDAINYLADKNKKKIYVSVLTAVVNVLIKEGNTQNALAFLLEAEQNGALLDVVVYSIAVDGLCKAAHLGKALDLCSRMRAKGIYPNVVIYNSIINGLCQQGCLIEAMRIFDSLEPSDINPTIITYSTLIGALSREGFLEDAENLFKRMVHNGITPNTRIYNSLIHGYCSFGLIENALKILSELEETRLNPDAFTISTLIAGYCQKGDTQDAYGFFNECKRRGFSPDFLGFLSLVEGLFIKRRMKEARDVLNDMLQFGEVVNILDRVSNDHHVDSLSTLLTLFCDQGRIHEAICVLSEVASEAFTSWRSNDGNRNKHLKQLQKIGSLHPVHEEEVHRSAPVHETADMNHGTHKVNNDIESCEGDYELLLGKSVDYNFDHYYSIIASLCSNGELKNANGVVKTMLMDLDKHCQIRSLMCFQVQGLQRK